MRRALWIGIVALIATLSWKGADAEEVDLALVLAVDVSTSIDEQEFSLQRRGYAEAFKDPAVIAAIRSGPHRKIAVVYVEWASNESQAVVVPWTVVSDDESGVLLAQAILAAPRSFQGWTSISGAIDFSAQAFAANPHTAARRVIDVSGDGVNNAGRPASDARNEAVAASITINGLVIMNDVPSPTAYWRAEPPLDQFYREQVIGGPGAFVIVIDDFTTFAQAILHKLVREIAGEPRPDALAQARPAAMPVQNPVLSGLE